MVNTKTNEQIREAQKLLTVAVFDRLVNECLGSVPVLCVVGKCRTGKTWAAEDWIAERTDDQELAAYVDCRGFVYGEVGQVRFGAISRDVNKGHYPKFALDGVDIVIVDDPSMNPKLVDALIERTAVDAGTGAHRLVVLLLQHLRELDQFQFGKQVFMTYSTAGLPI